jgi:hypothetical protein
MYVHISLFMYLGTYVCNRVCVSPVCFELSPLTLIEKNLRFQSFRTLLLRFHKYPCFTTGWYLAVSAWTTGRSV